MDRYPILGKHGCPNNINSKKRGFWIDELGFLIHV
jgi:hypothetical protein